jgi:hypothetical protein
VIDHTCPIRKVSPDDGWHYWFGYYDKCPWSPDSTRLLAHRATFCDRFPAPGDIAEVGWIEGWRTDQPRFVKAGETTAWNWQQGAMLRWNGEQPICNTAGTVPCYTAHPDTQAALTLDFGRLSRLRPEYGHPGLTDPTPDNPHPETHGISRIDGDSPTLNVSIDQLDRITADGSDRAGGDLHQHVNHLMFNPSGTRFCFMHRFLRTDGILHSRLFTSDLEGTDIRLLFEGLVSHYDWRDDQTILAWAGKRSLLGSANATKTPAQHAMTLARRGLKPIYYAMGKPRFLMNKIMKDSYMLIADVDVRSADVPEPVPFAKGNLTCDGHCTFSRGGNRGSNEPGRWVLTDGYPDMKNRQPLFLWDCTRNQGYEVGRYHTPRELDGDIRVDLHPRFNQDATLVCIDSAMDGKRAMYVVDVSSLTGGA